MEFITRSRPNVATVREVWRQRHGYRAAPLLLVVTYPDGQRHRAVLCGPAGDDPRVVDLDYEQAEWMAAAALERVINLGENRIGMRITRSAWFLRDLRFPHS
jgi:hypothetical protein